MSGTTAIGAFQTKHILGAVGFTLFCVGLLAVVMGVSGILNNNGIIGLTGILSNTLTSSYLILVASVGTALSAWSVVLRSRLE